MMHRRGGSISTNASFEIRHPCDPILDGMTLHDNISRAFTATSARRHRLLRTVNCHIPIVIQCLFCTYGCALSSFGLYKKQPRVHRLIFQLDSGY